MLLMGAGLYSTVKLQKKHLVLFSPIRKSNEVTLLRKYKIKNLE